MDENGAREVTPFQQMARTFHTLSKPPSAERWSPDERLRFQHFTVFVLLGVPTMVAYGILNLGRGNLPLALAIGLAATGLIAGWVWFRKTGRWALIYRTNILLFSGLVIYLVVIGGEGGSKSLWAFTLPLITLFNLGKAEGFVWVAGFFLAFAGVLFASGSVDGIYTYPTDFKVRFLTTYLIVSALSYWFEHSRHEYRALMEEKHRRLEAEIEERKRTQEERESLIQDLQGALEEVKALSGLLPICSHCHRIRDDQGYWNRLESFIGDRSDAQFSHGICPGCLEEHYPDDMV